MRILFLLILMLLMTTPSIAKTVKFNLKSTPSVSLVDVDIEESGAIYDGGSAGPTFETSRGEKIFRAIITARIIVREDKVRPRLAYYKRFQSLGSKRTRRGTMYAFRIKDVVRFPVNVVKGGTIDFKIHFDPTVPGLTWEDGNGKIVRIDPRVRFKDNQELGITPKAFSGQNSTSPRRVCVETRSNPKHPMIEECVRWKIK